MAGSLYGVGFGGFIYELLRILFLDPAAHHDEHAGVFLQGPLQLPFGIELTEAVLVQKLFAVLIILLFLYINYRGTSETGAVGNIVTVLKVIIIGIFIVSGLFVVFGEPARLESFQPFDPNGIIGIVSAMGLTFIAFEGYEIIVQAGEEVRNPRKNIPRAVFLSLAIVVPIYMLVAFVIIGAVDPPEGVPIFEWLGDLGEIGIARAAAQFMPFGTFLIMVGGLLSTMSALNATTFSSTRVSFAMGRDRALPDSFSAVSAKTRTPHVALGWSGVLILFVALTLPIEDVAASADIMFILLFLQVNLAVITIRGKYGKDLKYGFLLPFFPILPMIAIGMQFLLVLSLFNVSIIAWVFAAVWIGSGFLIYFFYAHPRQERAHRTPVVQQTELLTPVADAPYRVLVPVANPDSLSTLLPPAVNAARLHDGKVTLLHIVTVPSPTPLSSGYRYLTHSDALRERAIAMIPDEDVAVEYIVRVARRVAPAIIDTAQEQHADLLVIGWQGEKNSEGRTTLGPNIDQVLAEVNCDVMMLQTGDSAAATRILMPVAEPRQVAYSLGLIQQFSAADLQLDLLHVFAAEATSAQRERMTPRPAAPDRRRQSGGQASQPAAGAKPRPHRGHRASGGRLRLCGAGRNARTARAPALHRRQYLYGHRRTHGYPRAAAAPRDQLHRIWLAADGGLHQRRLPRGRSGIAAAAGGAGLYRARQSQRQRRTQVLHQPAGHSGYRHPDGGGCHHDVRWRRQLNDLGGRAALLRQFAGIHLRGRALGEVVLGASPAPATPLGPPIAMGGGSTPSVSR